MSELVVTASLVGAGTPPITGGRAQNSGWLEENPLVQVLIKFPTAGWWQVTGRYKDRELTFSAWASAANLDFLHWRSLENRMPEQTRTIPGSSRKNRVSCTNAINRAIQTNQKT
jgi:hypothetical protein